MNDTTTDTGFCDGCLEERADVETCECGITRCDQCRIEGCPRCGPKWTDRYWRGGGE